MTCQVVVVYTISTIGVKDSVVLPANSSFLLRFRVAAHKQIKRFFFVFVFGIDAMLRPRVQHLNGCQYHGQIALFIIRKANVCCWLNCFGLLVVCQLELSRTLIMEFALPQI